MVPAVGMLLWALTPSAACAEDAALETISVTGSRIARARGPGLRPAQA